MLNNNATLAGLRTTVNASFASGLAMAESQYDKVATTITSGSGSNTYGWLKDFPGVRKWIGDRVVHSMAEDAYVIENELYEDTVGIRRIDVDDDNLGMLKPRFEMLGQNAAAFREQQIFAQLGLGFETNHIDGQFFFDTDHPILDVNGNVQSVANTDGGSGAAWYLIANNTPLKPVIFQLREEWEMTAKDKNEDDVVFDTDSYVYGLRGRSAVGYGFWQTAWGSKQPLNPTTYETAITAMGNMVGDYGKKLGQMSFTLAVPVNYRGAATQLLKSQLINGGESNQWADTADLLISPWL